MPGAQTTWVRESARLAYFAVAMSERRDESLLLLYEQTNNALESYLKATDTKPPRLAGLPGPPPTTPLPSLPARTSSRRPLSIMAPEAKTTPSEPKGGWSEPSSAVSPDAATPAVALPSAEARRQYCAAFAAVDNQLPRSDLVRYLTWLAVYDVCLGQAVDVAARTRQVPADALHDALKTVKAIGPKAYLDQALALRLPPGHAL